MSKLSDRHELHLSYADNSFVDDLLKMVDCPKELERINQHHADNDPSHEQITMKELNSILIKALRLRLSPIIENRAV